MNGISNMTISLHIVKKRNSGRLNPRPVLGYVSIVLKNFQLL